ncbi:hypothetical protein IX339_000083 [Porphyromonas levii]|uniref:Card1-like endonuclease domain-containing protein n=1 Tax=Porphyromonas levii TaxID=28114 RepID=UPI001B8B0C7C|nr:DUF1887 family CARF protein [Porphyromonas levii]MBR8730653.1 hypothetical protein [Porphyromonas levii]
MTYLISVLSQHLVPNYLLAKELEGKYDQHILITSSSFQKRGIVSTFVSALNLQETAVRELLISEDNLEEAQNALTEASFGKDDKYIVNITGGTKIMSIALFQHFFKYDAELYYVPFGSENKLQELRSGSTQPIKYRMNIKEYLSLYGLDYKAKETRYFETDSAADKFEKYVFNRIKNEKRLSEEKLQIARGVEIYRDKNQKQNDNEIDVMWIEDNQLSIAECKTSLNKPIGYNIKIKRELYLDEILYKLAAIAKDFGIAVKSYVMIRSGLPSDFNNNRLESIEKRMRILGIRKILSQKELQTNKLDI